MASPGALLELAADLERRDREIAETLDWIDRLDRQAEQIRARSEELRHQLEAAPARLATLDRLHAEARDAFARTAAAREETEARIGDLGEDRRDDDERRHRLERELARAREAETDATARLERVDAERLAHEAEVAAARAAEAALVLAATGVSDDLTQLERLSASGRERPSGEAGQLGDWSSRVRAALFVVRGQLQTDRERLVREANELGGAVLGEQLAGSSVELVRRRLEEALRP